MQTGTANLGILPWAVVSNNGTVTLATSTVIGASGYLRNLAAGESTAAFVNLVNNNAGASSTLSGTATTASTITDEQLATLCCGDKDGEDE